DPIEESWVELAYAEPARFSFRKPTESGTFVFEGVPVKAELRLTYGADGYAEHDETLTLERDTVREIPLEPLASIRGRVLGPAGEPVTAYAIRAVNEDDPVRLPPQKEVEDSAGRFDIWPIQPAGRHTLEIRADGYALKRLENVIVEEGRRIDVGDLRLEPGHTVEGYASGPDGTGAEGARVWLAPRSGGAQRNPLVDERSFADQADGAGRYSVTGLSPGFFIANAQHPDYAPWSS
ncbi:MAG: hypothetical protein GTO30_16760, partial [Acidobacteria bacterium]|nr:hypothetical protein [Acidobacteriota bacterium]NIQ85033.1 hypothetical protein [Acidobacteriota bacterium]